MTLLKHIAQLVLGKHVLFLPLLETLQRLHPLRVAARLLLLLSRARQRGRYVVRVLIQCLAGETVVEDANHLQHHARSDFRQLRLVASFRELFRLVLGVSALGDLIVANPDLVVHHEEGHQVVDERLALRVSQRNAEHLLEHLAEQLQFGRGIELLVEHEKGTRSHQTVARHLQFLRRVDYVSRNRTEYTIMQEEANRRAVGNATDPHVHIDVLSCLRS